MRVAERFPISAGTASWLLHLYLLVCMRVCVAMRCPSWSRALARFRDSCASLRTGMGARPATTAYVAEPPPDWSVLARQEDRFMKQMEELADQMVHSSVQESEPRRGTPLDGLGPPPMYARAHSVRDARFLMLADGY